MGSVGGNLIQSTTCWLMEVNIHAVGTAAIALPRPAEGEHREMKSSQDFCAFGAPFGCAAALVASTQPCGTTRRELAVHELYGR